MSGAVSAAFFAVALLVAFWRGAGTSFVVIYLPALLLLSKTAVVGLPLVPDVNAPFAALYGILIGGALKGSFGRIRWTALDAVVVLVVLSYAVSATLTAWSWTGVSTLGHTGLALAAPYFITRICLESRDTQRRALWVLVAVGLFVALVALVEMRLWPFTYNAWIRGLALGDPEDGGAGRRYGFFRSMVSFDHPIDLGLSAGLCFAAICVLALRSGTAMRRRWIRGGLGAWALAAMTGISFTSLMGWAVALAFYFGISRLRVVQRSLTAGVMAIIAIGLIFTISIASTAPAPLAEDASEIERSYYVRHFIVYEAWSAATTAGLFGWGERVTSMIDLRSVDNAYLLIAMNYGWIALSLWLLFPVLLARLAARSLRRRRRRADTGATLIGLSAVVGTMVAMFTVWFGFVYQSLFMIVAALTVNATQARVRVAAPAPRREPAFTPTLARPTALQ